MADRESRRGDRSWRFYARDLPDLVQQRRLRGEERHVGDGVPFPRRMALSVLTLGAGLGISLAYGHIGDAIVIAVVMLPGIGLMLLWVYARTKTNEQQCGDA